MGYIYEFKTSAMHRLLSLVSIGYRHYSSGTIPLDKAAAQRENFRILYDVDRDKDTIYRLKKKGFCSSKYVMYYCRHDRLVRWWVLASGGHGPIKAYDLKNAALRDERLCFPAPKKYFDIPPQYELLQLSRKKTKYQCGGISWTWGMTQETYEAELNLLAKFIRQRQRSSIEKRLNSLQRTPGFYKSRRQAFALCNEAKKMWIMEQKNFQRNRNGSDFKVDEWPFRDRYIGWVGRYKDPETQLFTPARFKKLGEPLK